MVMACAPKINAAQTVALLPISIPLDDTANKSSDFIFSNFLPPSFPYFLDNPIFPFSISTHLLPAQFCFCLSYHGASLCINSQAVYIVEKASITPVS